MMYETPQDTYNAYTKFLKKQEYKKAYRCLEKMLHEFPDDTDLLLDIVNLCLKWNKPEYGKPWMVRLANIRSLLSDYLLLSHMEAELDNIPQARKYLQEAKSLHDTQPNVSLAKEFKKSFSELKKVIDNREQLIAWKSLQKNEPTIIRDLHKETRKTVQTQKPAVSEKAIKNPGDVENANQAVQQFAIPSFSIPVKIRPFEVNLFTPFFKCDRSPLKECQLFIDYTHLTLQGGFDELLCLNAIRDMENFWYQIETVKKVLRYFHGRVLLCDEVGLGKTIEAGMLIKEYVLRGMVKNILILTPASLVSQWRDEMEAKFGIRFMTTDDIEFMRDHVGFWKNRFIIASINTAKSSKNMPAVTEQFYDLLIVDEAHHLRNRTTISWKLVNQIKKRFIFLLTATPVQNNLIELFNLITLLKPGQFKTERIFRQEYLQKGNPRLPANREKLKDLLRDVMIRNTRSAIDIKLPRRFATTIRLEPTAVEREIYTGINNYLKGRNFKKPMLNLLLREAGSSPFALKHSLLNMDGGENGHEIKEIVCNIDRLEDIVKGNALKELLLKNPDEKKIIFTQYLKSMDYIEDLLFRHRIPYEIFKGDMSSREKDSSIARFRSDVPVLVSTESGGEGRNMQFCNTIINFDLPWNPMRIEQRVGRLHRIGQTRDVFIFNLSVKETIEDYIIEILDTKINMFEMVIGEIDPILGQLGEDRDFEDVVMEIWLKSSDKESLGEGFEQFGNDLINAKSQYIEAKALDDRIFGEDFEI